MSWHFFSRSVGLVPGLLSVVCPAGGFIQRAGDGADFLQVIHRFSCALHAIGLQQRWGDTTLSYTNKGMPPAADLIPHCSRWW